MMTGDTVLSPVHRMLTIIRWCVQTALGFEKGIQAVLAFTKTATHPESGWS
jgi:hypothetical protein